MYYFVADSGSVSLPAACHQSESGCIGLSAPWRCEPSGSERSLHTIKQTKKTRHVKATWHWKKNSTHWEVSLFFFGKSRRKESWNTLHQWYERTERGGGVQMKYLVSFISQNNLFLLRVGHLKFLDEFTVFHRDHLTPAWKLIKTLSDLHDCNNTAP